MQTFLPYDDFKRTSLVLDKKRLFKQCVEVIQILNAMEGRTKGWVNHPATKMWTGYADGLRQYYNVLFDECVKRGFNFKKMIKFPNIENPELPKWLGVESFHQSHRSNLLRKDPVHYGQFGWTEPDDLPYIWPTND